MRTLLTAVLVCAVPGPPASAQDSPADRGIHTTFERLVGGEADRESDVQRLRLFSLAVERGETPSPLLSPGPFKATLRARLTLPLRDRHGFRLEGRGSVTLSCNGEVVLDGVLRPGKPLETDDAVRMKKGENELALVFESSVNGDGEFRLSWSGPGFGFEPIAPERLAWPANDPALLAGAQTRAGQQLFVERRCARCHEPEAHRIGESAFGELDATGPDLRAIGARAKADWLAAWLREPRQFRADATMPKFHFAKERDADDIAAYLAGLGVPLAAPQFAGGMADAGELRFLQLGCTACHTAPAEPRSEAALGARLPLDFLAAKWHPAALVTYLQEPRRDHAHTRMPDFALGRDDAINLAAFLLSVAPAALPVSRGDPEHGRKLVQQHDCVTCHTLDVPITERRARRLRNLKPERGCLAANGGDAGLDHELLPEQVAAVRAFLPFAEVAPFRHAPLDFTARHMPADRCHACHAIDGQPSVWALVAERAATDGPLPQDQDPVAQGVPALTWVGAKLQPSWITRFVTGQQASPRPWLHARMPSFHAHGAVIAAGLVREHGHGSQDEVQPPPDVQAAIHGERLLRMGKGLGCVQCHALGDQPPVQVFERAGIELGTARSRLRHEYFTRWLRDPTRLDPDSRMPKYADANGRTAITDVLGGDAALQFDAIWQFLGTRLPTRR